MGVRFATCFNPGSLKQEGNYLQRSLTFHMAKFTEIQGIIFAIQALCFIRNAYKERFSPLVKFLEKLRNGLVIFQKNKERKKGRANWIRNDKLVIIFFAWRNSLLFQTFCNQSLIKSIQTNIFALKNTLEPRYVT